MFRKSLVDKLIRRRFLVTLSGSEGEFAGVLTECDREVLIFEQCSTVPASGTGGTPTPIAGRVIAERINVAYLQELTGP